MNIPMKFYLHCIFSIVFPLQPIIDRSSAINIKGRLPLKLTAQINSKFYVVIYSFHTSGLFPYPLKTSENLWFAEVFRGYRKRPLT